MLPYTKPGRASHSCRTLALATPPSAAARKTPHSWTTSPFFTAGAGSAALVAAQSTRSNAQARNRFMRLSLSKGVLPVPFLQAPVPPPLRLRGQVLVLADLEQVRQRRGADGA